MVERSRRPPLAHGKANEPVPQAPESSVMPLKKILRVRPAGGDHEVVTVANRRQKDRSYCKRPCPDCPWRLDATGVFPARAFVHSAETAYDMSTRTFACHAAGVSKPRLCAGFLLRGADHNLAVRLSRLRGLILDDVTDGGRALHSSYVAMAIANGVEPSDPALQPCRLPFNTGTLAREKGKT